MVVHYMVVGYKNGQSAVGTNFTEPSANKQGNEQMSRDMKKNRKKICEKTKKKIIFIWFAEKFITMYPYL